MICSRIQIMLTVQESSLSIEVLELSKGLG